VEQAYQNYCSHQHQAQQSLLSKKKKSPVTNSEDQNPNSNASSRKIQMGLKQFTRRGVSQAPRRGCDFITKPASSNNNKRSAEKGTYLMDKESPWCEEEEMWKERLEKLGPF
jgi:hypothetical protein